MAKKVLDEMPKEEAEKALEAVEKEEKETRECKKCNAKKIIIPICIAVAVAVIGFACFLGYRAIFGDDPVKITTKAIRGLKDTIKDAKEESNGMTELLQGKDPVEISTKINLTLPEGYGKYNVNALVQVDSKNEAAKVDVKGKADGKEFINLKALFNDSKLYFKLADTMKNYYYLDLTEVMKEITENMADLETSVNPELIALVNDYDFTKLIDYAADSVDAVLSKDDFDKEKDTILINGKDVKATKYTAKIDQKKAIKIAKAFAKKAVADKDLIKMIALATDETEANIKEMFNELIDAEPENLEEGYILYSVYVSSLGKTLGYGFGVEDMGTITIGQKGDVTTIAVTAGQYTGYINIDEKSDDHVVITGSFMGMITAELDIKTDLDTIKKNKEYKETLDVKFTLSALGQAVKASLNAETTVKKIDKVDVTDVKNAINIEKMTYSEQAQFEREVEKSSLYRLLNGLFGSQEVTNYSVTY